MKYTKLLRILLLIFIAFILISVPVFAISYTASFVVNNTSATAYTMLPVISTVDNTYLAANGYITSTALDTRIELGSGSARPHMVVDDKVLTANAIPATSQTNLFYTTGNSALTSMDILTGYNGQIELDDAAAYELGNNFEVETSGYIDTSTANKYLVQKASAFQIYTPKIGYIAASILSAGTTKEASASGASTARTISPTAWVGQTFTASDTYYVTKVMAKFGTGAPSSTTMHIRNVVAGLPDGADIASTTSYTSAGDVRTFTFSSPVLLTNGNVYSFSLSVADNSWSACFEDAANPYAGGQLVTSGDSGATWAGVAARDFYFTTYTTPYTETTVATGDHVVKVTCTGGGTNLIGIQIDALAAVTAASGAVSVPDNANNILIAQSNVMPYIDYFKATISGVLTLHYQPIAIIANTTVSGTADAGSDTNTLIDAGALTQADDYWNYALVTIDTTTDGLAPQGETAYVSDFASATDEITLATNLSAGIGAGDTFTVEYGVLVDREGAAQNAKIAWGVNPTGTSVTLSGLVPEGASSVSTTETPSTEILSQVTVSNWFQEPAVTGSLLTNPMRPFVTILSDTTSLTEMQAWIFFGILICLMVTMACIVAVRGHLLVAGIACGASVGAMCALTIFPLWALIFMIGAIAAGLIAERSPSL